METRGIAGVPDLMHHKFVVRDGASVDGLDELDERLVVAAGERHRHARRARDRLRLFARLRAAVGERDGRAYGRRRAAPPGRRRRAFAPGFAPSTERRSRTGSRSTSARRGSASGSRLRCSPPGRSWGRSSRSCRRVAATSPASSTTLSSTRCSISGARTASASGRSRLRTVIEVRRGAARSRSRGRRSRCTTSCTRRSSPTTRRSSGLQPLPLRGAKRGERRRDPRRRRRRPPGRVHRRGSVSARDRSRLSFTR